MDKDEILTKVISKFKIEGVCNELKANTEGHINTTYISTFDNNGVIQKYTHQKINNHVFTKPYEVMENINSITNHISKKLEAEGLDPNRGCLQIVKTKDDELVYFSEDMGYWRTYKYIDDVKTFSTIDSPSSARLLGESIGKFQLQLSDFDGKQLYETIYHFHDMRMRYDQLKASIKVNYNNRIDLVKDELAFLDKNRERGFIIWDAFSNGIVPNRVTHNDTKMNNVLFSLDGKESVCVIDLDTVMPGTILFDTGDMIRTATATAEEDELDLNKMSCNEKLHKALIEGYLSKASFLTDKERSLLVESGRTITQIMAVRFLADFLNGDTYYHIERVNHNLDRARTQIKLMQDMDLKWEELNKVLD